MNVERLERDGENWRTTDGRFRIEGRPAMGWTIVDTATGREQRAGTLLEARIVISASRPFTE